MTVLLDYFVITVDTVPLLVLPSMMFKKGSVIHMYKCKLLYGL